MSGSDLSPKRGKGAGKYRPSSQRMPTLIGSEPTLPARPCRGVDFGGLSSRELEVLGLIAQGLHAHEAASRLFVVARTVDFHLNNAYRKLGATCAMEAVAAAMRLGFLPCFCRKRKRVKR